MIYNIPESLGAGPCLDRCECGKCNTCRRRKWNKKWHDKKKLSTTVIQPKKYMGFATWSRKRLAECNNYARTKEQHQSGI